VKDCTALFHMTLTMAPEKRTPQMMVKFMQGRSEMSKWNDRHARRKSTLEFKLEVVRPVKVGASVPVTSKILDVPLQTANMICQSRQIYSNETSRPRSRTLCGPAISPRDLSVTGGMAFAGGPYNHYFLQSTCRAAELLREGEGRNALLSCVSGILTKQAFGLSPIDEPTRPFVHADLTGQVARNKGVLKAAKDFSGSARVVGHTILYGRRQVPKAMVVVEMPDGMRTMVTSEDTTLIASMEQN
jgi:hypothetical protein